MKRILLLADAGSEHTEKWAIGLAQQGFEIGIFSIRPPAYPWYKANSTIHFLSKTADIKGKESFLPKAAYLQLLPKIKKAIREFKPDIVHAHYASSYGLLARLSGFKPYFISAWGTDVMKFPGKNIFNRILLKKNLEGAAKVMATSKTIIDAIHKVSQIKVELVYFGVDLAKFKPQDKLPLFESDALVIAAIKPLETLYCTDILIDAFAHLSQKHPDKKLRLLIVGKGSFKEKLEQKVIELQLTKEVLFTGRVDFSEVVNYFNTADIFVNISEYESFGVSVIEASACEKPVIVTDVGGLREVVEDGKTGYRIPVRDLQATVSALEKLILNPELRKQFGKAGRKKVEQEFDWKVNLAQMIEIYAQF